MPKLKRRKDGGYFIHAAGDNNPVNTFQVTDEGAEIVKSSGRALDEFFPDQLFYLLHDLDHLSTKGADPTDPTIGDITNIDWATDELSVESRVQVALQLIETHGVSQLFDGDAAKWVLGLTGNAPALLEPLVETIAAAAGYSYETIHEYDEMFHNGERLLDVTLCAYLQYQWLRDTATFDGESQHRQHRVVHGSTGSHIYIEVPSAEQTTYTIPTDLPESIDEALRDELRDVWGLGVGSAGFAALSSFELTNRHDVEHGVILPAERLADFPVDLPPRSALTEQYEALRLLQNHVEHVLSSPNSDVEYGDGSICDQWYQHIHDRLTNGSNGEDALGAQQGSRVDHTAQTYRDCYGDGEQVTDFKFITQTQPDESEQFRLFGFGIFDHGEQVHVPAAPETEAPLPVYPQSDRDLQNAVELLDEFPAKPSAGAPT